MKRMLLGILLVLSLISCSAPASPPNPSVQPTSGDARTTPTASAPGRESAEIPLDIMSKHPSEVDNSELPITPVEELHFTGAVQEYDIDTYRLVVEGLVENPLSLTYEDLLSRPQVTETVLLICPGVFWDNAEWTGTPLSLILEEAGLSPEASKVLIEAGGGYVRILSLEEAMADGVFLAYEVNGEPLPPDHGYPLRLVVRHQYGSKWVKWVERIEVTA